MMESRLGKAWSSADGGALVIDRSATAGRISWAIADMEMRHGQGADHKQANRKNQPVC